MFIIFPSFIDVDIAIRQVYNRKLTALVLASPSNKLDFDSDVETL